jgi:hypothetical protein
MPPVTVIEIIVKRDAPLPVSAYRLAFIWKRVAHTKMYDVYQAEIVDEPSVEQFEPLLLDMQGDAIIDFDHVTSYVKEVLIV